MGAHTAVRRAPRIGRVTRTGLVSAAAATALVGAGTGVADASTVVVDGSSTVSSTSSGTVSAGGISVPVPTTTGRSVSSCTADGVLDPLRPGFARAMACLTGGDPSAAAAVGPSTGDPSTGDPSTSSTDDDSSTDATPSPAPTSSAPASSTPTSSPAPAPTSQPIAPASSGGATSGVDDPPPPGKVESYRIP